MSKPNCLVYMATHMPTGKSYIGMTKNFPARKSQHKKPTTVLGKLMKKDGENSIEWTILKDNLLAVEAVPLEVAMIRKFNTLHPGGLNKRDCESSPLMYTRPERDCKQIHLSLFPDELQHLRKCARLHGCSITLYLRQLIRADMKKRKRLKEE